MMIGTSTRARVVPTARRTEGPARELRPKRRIEETLGVSLAKLAIFAAMGAATFGVSLVAAEAVLKTNGLDDIRPVLPETEASPTSDQLLATDTTSDLRDRDHTADSRLHAR